MSKIGNENIEHKFENVEQALTKGEHFIEKYQKHVAIAMIAFLGLAAVYYGYKKWVLQPQEISAQASIFHAQQSFSGGDFQLALDGDGDMLGFLDIIEDFGSTTSANLSMYYAGICYLQLGEFQKAIDYLSDYDANDELIKYLAIMATGDAYLELGKKDKALNYYESAVEGDNAFTNPVGLMKLGLLQEDLGKYDDALETYNEIKLKYKTSSEGRQIEKFITRAELQVSK